MSCMADMTAEVTSAGRMGAHGVVVGLLLHELGSHVERRALDGGHNQRAAGHGARKAEVAQLHAAVRADEHILRLHVAVDDAIAVQVVQRADQLLGYAAHLLLRQSLVVLQHLKQLPCPAMCRSCEPVIQHWLPRFPKASLL